MVVSVLETLTGKCVLLHSLVIEGADGIDIWSSSKSLKLFLGLVETEEAGHSTDESDDGKDHLADQGLGAIVPAIVVHLVLE